MTTLSTFTNVDSDGEPLLMDEMRKRVKKRTGNWPRLHHGRLVVLEDRHVTWLKNSRHLFWWLRRVFGRVHWRHGPSMVTKAEFFWSFVMFDAPPVSDAELGLRRIRAGRGSRYVPLTNAGRSDANHHALHTSTVASDNAS